MLSLHSHSYYSLLRGTIPIASILQKAEEWGSNYASLTDLNGMYGLVQFAQEAIKQKIKPVLGAVIDDPNNRSLRAVLLAKNIEGYSQICKIITTRKLKEDFKLADIFEQDFSNIFILSSSIDLFTVLPDDILKHDNVFAEVIISKNLKQKTRELYKFAQQKGMKLCASNPSWFLSKSDYQLHKVVSAIRENSTLSNLQESEVEDEEFYMKSPIELQKLFGKLPEALRNARYIAEQCNVNLSIGENKFPTFSLPLGETAYSYLWKICFQGLEQRYNPIPEKALKRLEEELKVIDELGYCDYFLVVWDIVREANQRNMLTVGRGSVANSLVAYCLDLTQVDPVEHNLYFERFLNKGRASPPDIDLDFSWKERDEIIKYVFDKYGYDKVAMISTTVTFQARSAFRETAKVFGIPNNEISKFSKFIPRTRAQNLSNLAEKFPEAKSLKFDYEPWSSVIRIASQLASFPKHLSIHPGGIVLSPTPITDYVALEYAKNKGLGLIITQPDMYPIEDLGLIKIDLLSQRSLGVLRDTMNKLKLNRQLDSQPDIYKMRDSGE